MLSKDAILGFADLAITTLEVPEWGGSVLVKDLNCKQREEVEIRYAKHEKSVTGEALRGLKVLVASYALVDAEGKPLFEKAEDLKALESKSTKALDRVFLYVMKRNALTPEAAREIAKN